MDRFGIELSLSHIADAREQWQRAILKFRSDVDMLLSRLLNEAAAQRMSVEQMARALRMEPDKFRDLMRRHNLDPHGAKGLLAKDAAETLAENAALLGVEPWEIDLMSPLVYLPMGEQLREQIEQTEAEPDLVCPIPGCNCDIEYRARRTEVSGNEESAETYEALANEIYESMAGLWDSELDQAKAEHIAAALHQAGWRK